VERAEGKAREEIERVRDAGVPPDWRDHVRKLRQENAEQRVELRKAAKREADLRQSAKDAADLPPTVALRRGSHEQG